MLWVLVDIECQLTMQEQVGYGGDFVYDKAVGDEIKWKEGKNLTVQTEIKKQRNKSGFYGA